MTIIKKIAFKTLIYVYTSEYKRKWELYKHISVQDIKNKGKLFNKLLKHYCLYDRE